MAGRTVSLSHGPGERFLDGFFDFYCIFFTHFYPPIHECLCILFGLRFLRIQDHWGTLELLLLAEGWLLLVRNCRKPSQADPFPFQFNIRTGIPSCYIFFSQLDQASICVLVLHWGQMIDISFSIFLGIIYLSLTWHLFVFYLDQASISVLCIIYQYNHISFQVWFPPCS